MESTVHRSFAALNDDELDGLVEVLIEQFGSTLDRAQFVEFALTLFEDIAGLETITTKPSPTDRLLRKAEMAKDSHLA